VCAAARPAVPVGGFTVHRRGGRERKGVDMEVEEEERDGVIPEEEEDRGEGLEDADEGLRSAPPLASSGLPGVRQALSGRPPRSSRPDTHPTTDASATLL
jgi:hypothetical protein